MMQRILFAVLAIVWLQAAVHAEENDAPVDKLANLEMEAQEIAAHVATGDLLRTNWNLNGVESVAITWFGYSGFSSSPPATESTKLDTQIATGEWARRISVANVQSSRCRVTCDVIPSTLPPFDMNWLTDEFWPLTRSVVRHDVDGDANPAVFSFFGMGTR
jgi:hypothetical protein